MRPWSWLTVLASLALPIGAHARLEPSSTGPSKTGRAALAAFNGFDRDRDHGLSLAELQARGRQKGGDTLFALLDGDGDSRISLKEFSGGGSGALLGRFDAYDVNKDGFVARREFPNFVDPLLFTALDRDRDGRASLREIRPGFAGSRATTVVAPEPRKKPQAKPEARVWCWVTGFGDGDWIIEAPVLWDRCHTGGSR